jgi:hypothetical protein
MPTTQLGPIEQSGHTDPWLDRYVSLQLSFSTADIEQGLFNTPLQEIEETAGPTGDIQLIVVHEDVYILQGGSPKGSVPLTEESGLFKIRGLDLGE